MSRSTFAFACINPCLKILEQIEDFLSKSGFVNSEYEREDVWKKDYDKAVGYIKPIYQQTAFAYCVWLKYKDDEKEYSLLNSPDNEITNELSQTADLINIYFGNQVKTKTIKVLEENDTNTTHFVISDK